MHTAPLVNLSVQGDWLKFEEDQRYSRDNIVVKGLSGLLRTGTVLGLVALGVGAFSLSAGTAGNGTSSVPVIGKGAQAGVYNVIFTAATKFDVEDPAGVNIGTGTVGQAFNKKGVAFTITAGATPFVAGDRATIAVEPGTGKYVPHNPAGAAGEDVAAGILAVDLDARGAADVPAAAVVRHAHIAPGGLVFKEGISDADKAAALAALKLQGILTVREV